MSMFMSAVQFCFIVRINLVSITRELLFTLNDADKEFQNLKVLVLAMASCKLISMHSHSQRLEGHL